MDNPYYHLRRSEDRETRLLAERYFGLVKLQEWTDASGKSVTAKYLAHDPNMQWVKLERISGRGTERKVLEFQYPVAKLSKSSQSRVRQIDALQKKLDEKVATGSAAGTDGDPAAPPADPGTPMLDDRGNEPEKGLPASREPRERPGRAEAARPPQSAPAEAVPFDPDPLGFAEMDLTPPATPADLTLPFGFASPAGTQ